ncbi:MAG: hypothetical protein Q9163_000136 [Psora crenata]
MSDLHLGISNFPLAGDIGRLQDYELFADFLESQCMNFPQVFLVLGNHGFHGISRATGLRLAAQLANEPRFHKRLKVLNRVRIGLGNDITILGCMLQSYVTLRCEQIVQAKIQDFRRIVDWTTVDHKDEDKRDLHWLKANIEQIRVSERHGTSRKIVVSCACSEGQLQT